MTNAFTLPRSSQVLKAMGRCKSPAQARKDAQRVNQYSDHARSTVGAMDRADQIRRGGR